MEVEGGKGEICIKNWVICVKIASFWVTKVKKGFALPAAAKYSKDKNGRGSQNVNIYPWFL